MAVDFCDYFWGDKNSGFDVLYQNMKYDQVSSKELADFIKERSSIEESYSRSVSKLVKLAGSGTVSYGSFAPFWQLIKESCEKLSTLHAQLFSKLSELVKEILKYSDDLSKRHKTIKDEEIGTADAVQQLQTVTVAVQKAIEVYRQKGAELEVFRKENRPSKDVERAEQKFKKSTDDYKILLEKHNAAREDFERKMTVSCRHFQEIEQSHLAQLKEFLSTYIQLIQSNYDSVGKIHLEFKRQCDELTVEKLLEMFVRTKCTGLQKPAVLKFEELPIEAQNSHIGNDSDWSSLSGPLSDNRERDKPKKTEGKIRGKTKEVKEGKTKSSRRTTSLLNLFVIQGGGDKSKSTPSPKEVNDSELSANKSLGFFARTPWTSAPSSPADCDGVIGSTPPDLDRTAFRASKFGEESPPRVQTVASLATWTTGFLKSRRDRKKEKEKEAKDIKKNNKKRDSDASRGSGKEKNGDKSDTEEVADESVSESLDVQTPDPTHEVDEEGYRLRPKNDWTSGGEKEERSAFYSSSDSDSDDEPERKFHVKINPIIDEVKNSQISASVDELRATVENISLPSSMFNNSKKNVSIDAECNLGRSQTSLTKSSQDLVGLNLSCVSPPSSSSPYTNPRDRYSPLDQASPVSRVLSPPPQSTDSSSGSRYGTASSGELGDVFSEVGEILPSLPPKQSRPPSAPIISRSTTPSFSSISLPRPPSRRGNELSNRSHTMSPSPVSSSPLTSLKMETSLSSITEKVVPPPVGLSRGPSPLTLGMTDTVPIAVAFQEMIHAKFKGTDESKCQVHITGELLLSFPSGIIQVFSNNVSPAQLTFRVKSSQVVKVLKYNNELLNLETDIATGNYTFHFNMNSLRNLLRTQADSNPSAAYFNVDIFRYQVQTKSGAQSCPLHFVSFWKCEEANTGLLIKYKYNAHACKSPSPLTNVNLSAVVDGGVKNMQSVPEGQWKTDTNRAFWKVGKLSHLNEDGGVGTIRSRFEIKAGPSSIGSINAQFLCDGTTLSGSEIELLQHGYRLSLVKKRFVSGSYLWEPDLPNADRYAAPPSAVSSQC
ncbi:F-BAR domain only protein 2-like isoform X1 [Artemia franciscana]|uniref:F-BAR domain only protein 2-like isoform X1 n=1 Tax=Artemia franciscana TaxID=6661 RepID=UPI0032D9EBE8